MGQIDTGVTDGQALKKDLFEFVQESLRTYNVPKMKGDAIAKEASLSKGEFKKEIKSLERVNREGSITDIYIHAYEIEDHEDPDMVMWKVRIGSAWAKYEISQEYETFKKCVPGKLWGEWCQDERSPVLGFSLEEYKQVEESVTAERAKRTV